LPLQLYQALPENCHKSCIIILPPILEIVQQIHIHLHEKLT
jgi:hypothetical protein